MNERRCPKCGTVYPGNPRFCPRDGSMLVEVQARPKSASAANSGTGVRTPATPPKGPGLDRASSLSNQILDARYQVLRKLGEGGMSYVYLAKEVASGEEVAVKVLSPRLATDRSSVERLRREAGLAMRLDHQNVCRIMRLGEAGDGPLQPLMPVLNRALLLGREVQGRAMEGAKGVDVLCQVCAG